jgi:hypothetical protein
MALSNSHPAFYAQGGYSFARGFDQIELTTVVDVLTYDVTNTLQIELDVQLFNRKLGIFKEADNISLSTTKYGDYATRYYDASYDVFFDNSLNPVEFNSITLTAAELAAAITSSSQIVSVGDYSTLYSDYVASVRQYFGYGGGFASLFTNAENFDISADFDADAFYEILKGTDASSNTVAYKRTPTGTITIDNVVEILRSAVDGNYFGNRDPSGGATASDPSDNSNYGVADGFLDGDIIWVPQGATINLSMGVDSEIIGAWLNNVGNEQLLSSSTSSTADSGAILSESTTSSLSNISRTKSIPLVIKLVNS